MKDVIEISGGVDDEKSILVEMVPEETPFRLRVSDDSVIQCFMSSVYQFSITFIGLSTDSLGPYGQIGNHAAIGYSIYPDNGTETRKWSASPNPAAAATFGTEDAPTPFASANGFRVYLHVTDRGTTITQSFLVRYAPGVAPSVADGQAWIVDDTVVNLNAAASGANLTFSYTASGLPPGVRINSSTGLITGTPTSVSSGVATITAIDQYGRVYTDTFTWSSVLRAQAVGGADLDLFLPTNLAASPINLVANWVTNGNTLTLVSVSPTLSAGLSVNSAGVMTGTPVTPRADTTYTLTMRDEYGRQTTDTFALEVVQLPPIATASGSPDYDFLAGLAIVPINLASFFSANGNTLTYSFVDSIPNGLSISSAGLLSGVPQNAAATSSYTLRAVDGFGRTTDLEVALEIIAPIFALTQTVVFNPQINSGTGDLTFGVTSPASYAGVYTVDQADGLANVPLNIFAIETAPQCLKKSTIARTSGGTNSTGSEYTATPGLWWHDNDDTVTVIGQWYLDGLAISGAVGLVYTANAEGVIDYRETVIGGGLARTATSNSITIDDSLLDSISITATQSGFLVDHTGSDLVITGTVSGILLEVGALSRLIPVLPGTYDVIDLVSNVEVEVTVAPVTISIDQIDPFANSTLTVTTNADANATYDWQINGLDFIPAEKNSTLDLTGKVNVGDSVRVIVNRDRPNTAISQPVTVTANLDQPAFEQVDNTIVLAAVFAEPEVTLGAVDGAIIRES